MAEGRIRERTQDLEAGGGLSCDGDGVTGEGKGWIQRHPQEFRSFVHRDHDPTDLDWQLGVDLLGPGSEKSHGRLGGRNGHTVVFGPGL